MIKPGPNYQATHFIPFCGLVTFAFTLCALIPKFFVLWITGVLPELEIGVLVILGIVYFFAGCVLAVFGFAFTIIMSFRSQNWSRIPRSTLMGGVLALVALVVLRKDLGMLMPSVANLIEIYIPIVIFSLLFPVACRQYIDKPALVRRRYRLFESLAVEQGK